MRAFTQPLTNALSKAVRQEIMGLVHERYADFGPTLACEKLVEQHGYRLSVETLRQWMIAEGLWKPKKRKAARIHQRRPRRPCPGELVQIDGSPHDWFEGRGPCCTLIVFIQASLRSRERFWDIRVPKIDSIFDNSLVPRPSWSPGVPPQHRKLVAATHRSPI